MQAARIAASVRSLPVIAAVAGAVGCGPAPYSLDPDPPTPPPAVVVAQPAVAPHVIVVPAPVPAASTNDIVAATLRGHYPALRKCYQKARRRNPHLRGSVVVRLVIDSDGEVDKVYDHGSDLPNRRVIACMHDVYEDVEFPRSVGGSTVIYPLYFAP